MPDNLPTTFDGFSVLAQSQLTALSGPDCLAFAQAQFANDVIALADGHWQWSAWLTAKGRVISVFQLLRLDPQRLLLIHHDGDAATVAEQLRRFVFRRKLSVEVNDSLEVSTSLCAPVQALGAMIAQLDERTFELDVGSPTLPRTLRLAPPGVAPAATAVTELAWRQSDLRHGLARLEPSQREQWTPQQLGLDRLNAYSVKKGCYPGQEIVARTHFLGKAKRALQLLQADHDIVPGTPVSRDAATLGTVASSAGPLALAVLPLELESGPLHLGDGNAEPLPLLDGLAR